MTEAQSTDTERWKKVAIDGLDHQYEVSSLGNIKSLDYRGSGQAKLLLQHVGKNGYATVGLRVSGKIKRIAVHRIVATAFIPNTNHCPAINHRNEVKTDNRVENLEWCTYRYNNNYGTIKERHIQATTNHPNMSKIVLQLDLNGNLVREWPSVRQVKRETGWSNGNISDCCHNKKTSVHGFVWRYKQTPETT